MKKLILIILIILPTFSHSAENYGDIRVSELVDVYDGDTFFVTIDGWPDIMGKRIGVRIRGIDTPEIRGKCDKEKIMALSVKRFTARKLSKAKLITLKNMSRGKYFRIVADVDIDGESLGERLITYKLAVGYDGGKKVDWCKMLGPNIDINQKGAKIQ